MRFRLLLLLVLGAVALVAAGCGGQETAPLPEEVEGPVPTEEQPAEPPAGEAGEGDPQAGAQVFASAGCGGCHAFSEAGSTGTVGPSFDDEQTSLDEAIEVITTGRGAMPAFGDQLSEQEIRDVAAYVSDG